MIIELLAPELLMTELGAETKAEALSHLARQVAKHNCDVDRQKLLEALVARELQASTGLGKGIAIPHARLARVERMIGALARSTAGIEWDAADGRPVQLVFLLVGPAEQPRAYLKALAEASRLLRHPVCRTRLLQADSKWDMLRVLRDSESAGYGVGAA